jgi:hypothetical protein
MADVPLTAETVSEAPPGAEAPAGGASDGERSYDLSLRLLTWLVLIALAGSVTLLIYRWLEPLSHDSGNRVTLSPPAPRPAPEPAASGPAKTDEVLMDPGHVFRCEEQGRVTFSDRACPGGEPGGAAH